jgi:2-phosphosulfolactate phosphatase
MASRAAVVIVVDVLSFSTAVSVAVSRGGIVHPFRFKGDRAAGFARSRGAEFAGAREAGGDSLSPASFGRIPPGTGVVLPSPDGAAVTLAAGAVPVLAGCLRNASAVARAAGRIGGPVAVIPAGERWPDGALRPAVEDLLGAGAIIAGLGGTKSPEARAAEAAFLAAKSEGLAETLRGCVSGRELIERGRPRDVDPAADLDADAVVPMLQDGGFTGWTDSAQGTRDTMGA